MFKIVMRVHDMQIDMPNDKGRLIPGRRETKLDA